MMETPQKAAPQSARKSSKQQQQQHHHHQHQHHPKPRTDTQKSVQSDNDVYLNTPQDGDKTPSKKNRKARAASNARRNGVQSDIGDFQEHEAGHRHASYSGKPKNTPAKAIRSDAYAGPTFHQSPAASAVPLPSSFMPRSLPNPSQIGTIAETPHGAADISQTKTVGEKREITPLDWMFDAARQARGTPNGASPARRMSPHTQSPAPSPGIRKEETDFPFELDGDDDGKSVYSTPLSQRFAASRTPQSTSEGGQTLTEEERQAKTAALKKALMNSGTPAQLGSPFNDSNPFNARNAPPPPSNPFSPRQTSNPPTPAYQNGYAASNQYPNYNPTSPGRTFSNQSTSRPPSSNLRNIYDPNFAAAPMSPPQPGQDQRISTARSPPPQRQLNYSTNFGAIYGQARPASEASQQGRNPKSGLEQGLDDLRKVLNLSTLGQQQ